MQDVETFQDVEETLPQTVEIAIHFTQPNILLIQLCTKLDDQVAQALDLIVLTLQLALDVGQGMLVDRYEPLCSIDVGLGGL